MNALQKGLKKLLNERNINLVMIFVLGFLIGIAAKMEAKKNITIGYGDYQIARSPDKVDLLSVDEEQISQQIAPDNQPEGSEEIPIESEE